MCEWKAKPPLFQVVNTQDDFFMELVEHLGINIFFQAFSQSSSAFYREGLRQPLRCLNRLRLEFLPYFYRFTHDFFLFYLSRNLLCCTYGAIQFSIIRRLIILEVAFLPLNESKPSFKGWRLEQSVGCVQTLQIDKEIFQHNFKALQQTGQR